MRHRNEGNEIVRHYWLFDDAEIEKFREMLHKHKKVKCISTILPGMPVAVQGSSYNLGRFEDDVF